MLGSRTVSPATTNEKIMDGSNLYASSFAVVLKVHVFPPFHFLYSESTAHVCTVLQGLRNRTVNAKAFLLGKKTRILQNNDV